MSATRERSSRRSRTSSVGPEVLEVVVLVDDLLHQIALRRWISDTLAKFVRALPSPLVAPGRDVMFEQLA